MREKRGALRWGWNRVFFVALHALALSVVWTGLSGAAWAWVAALYVARMFGVTAGYHRYFAHRSFETGRVFQCALAWLAQTSSQKGVLWWAAHHRAHHKHADTERDCHSPARQGFWYAHMGWFLDAEHRETRVSRVRDLAKYPELRWLDRWWWLCPWSLGALSVALLGVWEGVLSFALSTVLVWHATYCINSLAHRIGRRRFATPDESRNSALLALICLGEGWHNNHHRYMLSARQGFYWWELDLTWLALRLLSVFGVVRQLRPVPDAVLEEGRRALPGRPVVARERRSE